MGRALVVATGHGGSTEEGVGEAPAPQLETPHLHQQRSALRDVTTEMALGGQGPTDTITIRAGWNVVPFYASTRYQIEINIFFCLHKKASTY